MTNEQKKQLSSDEGFSALLNGLYETVLITEQDGKILEVNLRAEEVFAFKAEELLKRNIRDFVSGFDQSILKNVVETLKTQKHVLLEASCVRRDGATFPSEIAVGGLNIGGIERLCFSIRDVTSRNQTESRLTEAQGEIMKMQAIKARLDTITTLAHEINNPLQMLLSMIEADKNIRYAAPVNRIIAVMQEMRRDEELKTVKYAGGTHRFEILNPEIVRCRPNSVLIVDDEPTLVRFFESVVREELGHVTVDTAPDGGEALAEFHLKHHSVLVLDIAMPIMNGEETFHEIKRVCKEKNWEMPAIIFCTGYTPPESIRQAIARDNLHCYLPKPVAKDTLINAVKNRLEYHDLSHGVTPEKK